MNSEKNRLLDKYNLLIEILDVAKKTRIGHFYRHFVSALKWSQEELNRYRLKRLKQLLETAEQNTHYYQKLFKEANFNAAKVKTLKDIEHIPILERDTIRDRWNELLNQRIPIKRLFKGSSSGTTGTPITYYHDRDGISAGIAAGYVLWGMSGWHLGQRNVHIWGNAISIQKWASLGSQMKNALVRQMNVPATWLDDPAKLDPLMQRIIDYDPMSIEGYPSAIFTLAEHFRSRGYVLKHIKQVLTTAENLTDRQQQLIEDVFSPVGDLYGSGEIQGIATRPISNSCYHIFEPHVIVEAVDGSIPGMKDVLVTDLDNLGMPFIRYRIGDLIDGIFPPEAGSRYQLAFFNRLYGRNSDIIRLPNGKCFHPVNIFGGTLFRKFPEITRHQVQWDGVSLRFVFEHQRSLDELELKRYLEKVLNDYRVSFSIEHTERISIQPGGKHVFLKII